MKIYSFKLNEEIPEESELITRLESWREKGGTVKSFMLERITAESQYLSQNEWRHEKAVLNSLYALFADMMDDMEKLKKELNDLKPKPMFPLAEIPDELQQGWRSDDLESSTRTS